jgi:hypothetical protein
MIAGMLGDMAATRGSLAARCSFSRGGLGVFFEPSGRRGEALFSSAASVGKSEAMLGRLAAARCLGRERLGSKAKGRGSEVAARCFNAARLGAGELVRGTEARGLSLWDGTRCS